MMRIKELREEKKLSQTALAQSVGTSQRNIGRWENGENEPTYSQLVKIADYFGVTIDYLVGREDDFGVVKLENLSQISNDEKELISVYKLLSKEEKQKVLSIVKGLKK